MEIINNTKKKKMKVVIEVLMSQNLERGICKFMISREGRMHIATPNKIYKLLKYYIILTLKIDTIEIVNKKIINCYIGF